MNPPPRSRPFPAFRCLLVPLALCAALAAQKKSPKPQPGDPVVAGEDGKALDAMVDEYGAPDGGFCGTVLVAKDGRVLLEKGYGLHDAAGEQPMRADALWDWASVSKQFTAAALLRLQDKKKIVLDDVLARHWPKAPADKAKVTARHLLNHTSGIEAGFKAEWTFDARQRGSLEECVLTRPVVATPGDAFEYSNSGYALAAALIEKVTGKTFEQYCIDELFRPAGMREATMIGVAGLDLQRVPKVERGAGFADRPKDFRFAYGNELSWGYRGCGGVVATVRDMLAWDRALRADKLLSKRAKKELYTVAKGDYALGWFVRETELGTVADHSGAVLGVVTEYLRLLDEDVTVAIACSYRPKEHPGVLAKRLAARALR